ncbi:MAG TPA: nuclear transport factor 2 family protein [Rhodanobacteraceae bacterium]|nr:nuclear transport factor 2 family protein [Rhodanobacteraceae bacterium]
MSIDSSDAVAAATRTREQRLLRLNEQYVHASLSGDVEWCRAHLADDFVCIDSDGSVQFRTGFLRAAALGSDLSEYKLDYVDVRFYGEVALVRASGSWVSKTRLAGISRYTDVYVYDGAAWKVVSAQITRPTTPA